jgi:AMMECR1 domain-containing protein
MDAPMSLARRAQWALRARARFAGDPALHRTLDWIRTIALEDDAFALVTGRDRGVFRFAFPSRPEDHPERLALGEDDARVRFVVSAGEAAGDGAAETVAPGWRRILRFDGLSVVERDAPHGRARPLRLGLTDADGWALLRKARAAGEGFVAGREPAKETARGSGDARLSQRSMLAVSMWTRGRLRGSIVCPPAPALATARRAGELVCKDARFERPTLAELADTVFQVGLVHAPAIPLSREEIRERDAYADKALFVSEAAHFGAYMPEVFNVRADRKLAPLLRSLAREKAGLEGIGAGTRVEACEVSEVVESADRTRAVALDGPLARVVGDQPEPLADAARAAGGAACAWLVSVQQEDGSWPVRVRPATGAGAGRDPVRVALVAFALAAYGGAARIDEAPRAARRALAWLERARSEWTRDPVRELWTHCYVGRTADCLGDAEAFAAAVAGVGKVARAAARDRMAAMHAASLSRQAAARDPDAARRAETLGASLYEEFRRARDGKAAVSLAEWAELATSFPPDSRQARDIDGWLRSYQLPDGSFPETTASRFAYTRGTGKVFEVLAQTSADAEPALARCLGWLRTMQYRLDSVFFVPQEHRSRVLGGLRHDVYDTDAWVDAAGHLLIGLAHLAKRAS